MTVIELGNKLHGITRQADGILFELGRLTQLSYSSYEFSAKNIHESEEETITLSYPIGQNPDGSPMLGKNDFPKKTLIDQYSSLANHSLPLTSIYRIVTTIEAMLSDMVREVILAYPKKLGSKKKIDLVTVLESDSIEAIHAAAIDSHLNELAYKSPKDFAVEVEDLLGVNLLEIPAYHTYIEVKATRDIHIHNSGVTNEIYLEKTGSHARVHKVKMVLPVDNSYFLKAYEASLQIVDALREELYKKWGSSDFEASKLERAEKVEMSPVLKKAEAAKKIAAKKAVPKKVAVKKVAVKKVAPKKGG